MSFARVAWPLDKPEVYRFFRPKCAAFSFKFSEQSVTRAKTVVDCSRLVIIRVFVTYERFSVTLLLRTQFLCHFRIRNQVF